MLALGACSRSGLENDEAIRQAVAKYLTARSDSTGIDPSAMDINVDAVAYERDVARATISFTIKGTDQGMQMNYTLDRDGDEWVVRGPQDQTAVPHAFPSADDQIPGEAPQTPALPPGHVPVEGATPAK